MSVVDCTSISVGSAQDAVELALLLVGECHGKRTTVAWDGAVVLTIPLTIPDGSTIIIMGLGPDRSALLGGGTTFPLLAAQGADLTLQRLQVGRGVGGGVAGWGSNITAQHCEFESNGSEGDGAAIRLDQGKLDLTNCSFVDNHAEGQGGALYTAQGTNLFLSACTFADNVARVGGAVFASHVDVADGTRFVGNSVSGSSDSGAAGGAIFLNGTYNGNISQTVSRFADGVCTGNAANGRRSTGGCISLHSVELEFNGGELYDNSADDKGGAIHVGEDAALLVKAGVIENNSARLGGAIHVDGEADNVAISGGSFALNQATLKGGMVYVDRVPGTLRGRDGTGLKVTISGGHFEENSADESGGAVYLHNGVSFDMTGGNFLKNTARYNGGCVAVFGSSLRCAGATMEENVAGDEGGGIYAQDALDIILECGIIGNSGQSGAAIYAVNSNLLNVTGSTLRDNKNDRGGVLHAQNATVIARDVVFIETRGRTGMGAIEISSESSVLEALNCTFIGWAGDAMIVNGGRMTLDECGFEESSATTLVYSTSTATPAVVRNSRLGALNYDNELNNPGVLVRGAVECGDNSTTACAMGCVPGLAGVLCRCYEQAITRKLECLDNAGPIDVRIRTPPANTLAPNDVRYELAVTSSTDGGDNAHYTGMVWHLEAMQDDDLVTSIVPISGIVQPGEVQTVTVVSSPLPTAPLEIIGGVLARGLYPQSYQLVEVNITYFQCPQYSYYDLTTSSCEFCSQLQYNEGVDCSVKGASVQLLPIKPGYWRQTTGSLTVKQCPYPESCLGSVSADNKIRTVASTNEYCLPGSIGKYCAECAPGYAGRNGIACNKCNDGYYIASMAVLLTFTCLLIILAWVLVMIYLVGGVKAVTSAGTGVVGAVRRSVKRHPYGSAAISFRPEDPQQMEVADGRKTSSSTLPSVSLRSSSIRPIVSRDGVVHGEEHASPRVSLSERMKMYLRRLIQWVPFRKLRIMIVVWQIITQFPEVAYISYPRPYSNFLSYINFINFNFVSMFSVSCVFTHINFYHELLTVTLVPLAMVVVMGFTFAKAYRETVGNSQARQEAVARHAGVGLLVAFLILSSASTTIARTFICESFEDLGGERFLKADYSLSCDTQEYRAYRAYASLMIVYYPIGIPVLFLSLLWANKDRLDPEVMTQPTVVPCAPEDVEKAKEQTRAADPLLKPTRILWGAYAPGHYTFEVVECGRRLLLTSALVMIEPGTTTQCALACVFAFLSLVGFELIMPYTSKDDAWLYRMGCMIVFFSNFLALMMKAKIADEAEQRVFAALLVFVNIALFFSIWFTAWVSARETADTTVELLPDSFKHTTNNTKPTLHNTYNDTVTDDTSAKNISLGVSPGPSSAANTTSAAAGPGRGLTSKVRRFVPRSRSKFLGVGPASTSRRTNMYNTASTAISRGSSVNPPAMRGADSAKASTATVTTDHVHVHAHTACDSNLEEKTTG